MLSFSIFFEDDSISFYFSQMLKWIILQSKSVLLFNLQRLVWTYWRFLLYSLHWFEDNYISIKLFAVDQYHQLYRILLYFEKVWVRNWGLRDNVVCNKTKHAIQSSAFQFRINLESRKKGLNIKNQVSNMCRNKSNRF